jgi:hypothetical protein
MTTMKWLRRASLPGLVALAATVSAGPASASTLSANGIVYAIQSVNTAGGTITIPGGNLTYTTGANTVASVLGGSFVLTFTLPSGVTPTGAVTATVANVGAGTTCAPQATLASSSASGSTITFTVPTNPAVIGNICTVTLNTMTVSGATALETINPGLTIITYKAQLTANTTAGFPIDGAALTNTFASSFSGLFFTSLAPATPAAAPLVIDVAAAGLGKKFKQFGADSVVADIGDLIVLGIVGLVEQDGASPFTIGVGQITITLTGNFNNIQTASLTPFTGAPPTGSPCGTTGPTPGTQATSVTPTTITFTGISLGVPLGVNIFTELCLAANGNGIIGANPPGATVETVTATVSSTPPTTQKDPGVALLPYTYNGSVQQLLYATANPTFPFFVRIVNNAAATANVIAVIQPEGGTGNASTTPIAVPGNSNQLIPMSTIASLAGVTFGPGNFRSSLLFLTPGVACINNVAGPICPVSISGLIGEPSGNVNMMGSGGSP